MVTLTTVSSFSSEGVVVRVPQTGSERFFREEKTGPENWQNRAVSRSKPRKTGLFCYWAGEVGAIFAKTEWFFAVLWTLVVVGPRHPPSLVVTSLDSMNLSHKWSVPSPTSLSLSCGRLLGWMAMFSTNGGTHNDLGLRHLHGQEIGGEANWRRNGWAVEAHFGPIRSPLPPRGSSHHFVLEPL
jgi:hypothetical protein